MPSTSHHFGSLQSNSNWTRFQTLLRGKALSRHHGRKGGQRKGGEVGRSEEEGKLFPLSQIFPYSPRDSIWLLLNLSRFSGTCSLTPPRVGILKLEGDGR